MKTINGCPYFEVKKKPSPTGVYCVEYGEFEDREIYYFTSYEKALKVMRKIAMDDQWGDSTYGPYPLLVDDDRFN